jgi:hypothetical protein
MLFGKIKVGVNNTQNVESPESSKAIRPCDHSVSKFTEVVT